MFQAKAPMKLEDFWPNSHLLYEKLDLAYIQIHFHYLLVMFTHYKCSNWIIENSKSSKNSVATLDMARKS